MKRQLLRALGIQKPIIQAPMAGVSTPAMAAAVSNAGGLGSLGLGAAPIEEARASIVRTRTLTDKAFGVNVFCHQPARADAVREARWLDWLAPQFARFSARPPATLREIYTSFVADPAMLSMLLEERPAVVSFHFGLPPAAFIDSLHNAGIYLMATATKVSEAEAIVAAGLDAVVAQGSEAGGHRGSFDPAADDEELGTFALTRLLVKDGRLPVIAAGGIMDGAGVAAALALGADAAQLGTAFVPCPESSIDQGYRHALLDGEARATVFTSAISGRKARSLVNEFTRLELLPDRPPTPGYPIAYDAGKSLHAAARMHGVFGFGAQWAGQGARLARFMPAADLMQTLDAELQNALRVLSAN